MSFFSSKKESECVLVFDVGNGSVGGAIILTSKTHTPIILYSLRSDIPFQEKASGARLLSLMLRSLSQVVLAISHEGFDMAGFGSKRPCVKEAIISLASPFVVSKTYFLELRNKKPLPITQEVFAALLRHSREEKMHGDFTVPKGSVQIEQKLIKSALNGYETSFFQNKTAKEAEFAIFESFSVPRVVEKISDTLTHLLHANHISFHSFSLIAFATIRDEYPELQDFMIADISGEQTEIGMVKKGTLTETATFPMGKNHFIRTVERQAKAPASGVSSFLQLYVENKGTGVLFERAKKLLQEAEKEWLVKFSNTLSSFSQELFLSRNLFITTDDDVAPLFCNALKREDFSKFTLSPDGLRVIALVGESLDKHVRRASSLSRDSFISLISIFANRIMRKESI